MSNNTDIDLVSKALADFNAVEAGLQLLRERFAGVVFDVTTGNGMAEAKQARLTLREPRYEVERIRKAAKSPLLALGKKLDEDAKRITAEIEKIEAPIDQQIKSEEERKEREKQERIAAEAARVQEIQDRITELRAVVSLCFCDDAALVLDHIGDIERIAVDDSFAEFQDTAADAKAASLARLREIHAGIVEREAEKVRIAAERAELERLRAEQAERDRIEREQRTEDERIAKAARDAEAKAAAEALRVEREALAAAQREQQKAADAENARLAAERAEIERQQEALRKAKEPPPAAPKKGKVKRPTDAEIIFVVAEAFNVSEQVAAGWLAEMRVAA
jgi:hypothetical protein